MPGKLIVDEIEDSGGSSVIGRKNAIINGNFDIWQRGTSGTGGYCSADRWEFATSGATGTFAQGSFTAGQTDVPNNPKFYGDITITGADDNARIEQKIEDVYTLAGETITISFWAKYTTNAPTSFAVQIAQSFGSGGSSIVNTTFETGLTLTTSWQKFEVTGTVPSISGKTIGSGSYLVIRPVHNSNNETFDYQIAQVQVEKGSVATDFEYRPIGEEIALCQRYYQDSGSTGARYVINGAFQSTTDFRAFMPTAMQMRTNPTITLGSSQVLAGNGGYDNNGVTVASSNQITGGLAISITCAATSGSFANFTTGSLRMTDYLLDAEL
jgi:hypothetical protein